MSQPVTLTPTQLVWSGRPQRGSNFSPGVARAIPTELPPPPPPPPPRIDSPIKRKINKPFHHGRLSQGLVADIWRSVLSDFSCCVISIQSVWYNEPPPGQFLKSCKLIFKKGTISQGFRSNDPSSSKYSVI